MTTDAQELIHSLRHGYPSALRLQAADALEALQAEMAQAKFSYMDGYEGGKQEARDAALAQVEALHTEMAARVTVQPSYYQWRDEADKVHHTEIYTPDQLNTAISAARVRALEDAVQVVLNHQAGWVPDGFTECADAIRALKRGG